MAGFKDWNAICAPKHSQVHTSTSVSHCGETTDLRKPRRCSKSALLKHEWALGILFECGPQLRKPGVGLETSISKSSRVTSVLLIHII